MVQDMDSLIDAIIKESMYRTLAVLWTRSSLAIWRQKLCCCGTTPVEQFTY